MTPDPAAAGLSSSEAAKRLAIAGPNTIAVAKHRNLVAIVLSVLREPMLALLAAGGVIYVLIGEPTDSAILLSLAMLSIVITIVQEARTERALEALNALTSPKALVVRDGEPVRIDASDVVVGDLMIVAEGDRVPADGTLLSGDDVELDESLLTGESVPVRKQPGAKRESLAPNLDTAAVFAGSLMVRGRGEALVGATGAGTEIGKIGRSLEAIESEPPRLAQQTRRLVVIFATLGGSVSLIVVLLYGLLRADWLHGLLAGLALGMAMLPEEFPVVLTIFMAMGAWRMSRQQVLARRASAIEALGSATVLCTDKTGTLTENRMSIVEIRLASGETFAGEQLRDNSSAVAEFLECGRLASAVDPYDPMERALHELGRRRNAILPAHNLARVHGLTAELLAVTQVWQTTDPDLPILVATKGAPEAIASLCRLPADAVAELRAGIDAMAAKGQRVLAIAEARADSISEEGPREYEFRFLGLVGFADPLRASVRPAVDACRAAGVRVVMITGDHPQTARAIATAAGIDASNVISGPQLAELEERELAKRVRDVGVFARVLPAQKLRIVNALKANGEIVAMTGDGVNDAPSLKAANIGVAMGKRGTDVAREASDIVLLDDDFSAIVDALRLGRRTYDNLRKSMAFILAVHVPIAGLALLPLLLGAPLLFGPIHIALIEMVIDPSCTLVFEAEHEEGDIMRRPPRRPGEQLFSVPLILWAALQGLVVLAVSAASYWFGTASGLTNEVTRGLVFATLVGSILVLILVNRSFSASLFSAFGRGNLTLGIVAPVVAAMVLLMLAWPPARQLVGFGPLRGEVWLVPLGGAGIVLTVLELLKPFWRRPLVGTAR